MYGMDGWCKEPNNAGNGSDCPKNAQNSEDRTTGDLISRAEAIDDLHGKDPSQIWDTADIEVWVNALPSAQPERRWVPCSERLPKEYGNYLITTHNGDVDVGTIDPKKKGVWSACDADGFYWIREVVAWMPLPEPYREVSE